MFLAQLAKQEIADHAAFRGAIGAHNGLRCSDGRSITGCLSLQKFQRIRAGDMEQGFLLKQYELGAQCHYL
ncbi:hypothetical protein GCM10007052_13800 [Halioglobus japonicus]|nr:hypothetical protein GCM10007052_13800 [Halioglobus japonicus]